MKALLKLHFGLDAKSIKKINGYENINYLVELESGEKCVLKTYFFEDDLLDVVQAENEILLHLSSDGSKLYPRPLAFKDASFEKKIHVADNMLIVRMLSFLDGQFLGGVPLTQALIKSFGVFVARMDVALAGMNNYVIQAREWEWDLQYFELNKKYLVDILDAHDRNIIQYFFMQFDEKVRPALPSLRKQIIHNDPNEWNVLTENDTVSGIIDFGDLAYTQLINEVAIARTYICLNQENPLQVATNFLAAYHDVFPLQENEMDVLYYLVAGRLCTSVLNAAHSRKVNPNNEYAFSTEKSAWQLLYKWLTISPVLAGNTFREAIGLAINAPIKIKSALSERKQHISSILSVSYKNPLFLTKSAFQYMYDVYGNTILDAYNNIPQVGHAHPKVVYAGRRQMAKLNTNTRYLYDLLPMYAERLLGKFPSSLNRVFFVNSGSAATDLAIRMAYAHSSNKGIMVMEHGYHGHTRTATDISHYKYANKKGYGQKEMILQAEIPDTYRGKFKGVDAGKKYAQKAIQQMNESPLSIAAFISEPIVGCAGQVPLANGYLKELYPAVRAQGGICISDEVQTGFGRLGSFFWGFEAHDVVPDMVVIGKPMGNGHPMGAVIVTQEIAESFEQGVEFFSSFGGNPVSCAIGLAVLDVIDEEKLQENAQVVGEYYMQLFQELAQKYPCIGDVRGAGLFIGVEIVKKNGEPDTKLAHHIKNELRNQHILISTDGPFDNVLKSKPALCFTKENAQTVVDAVAGVLAKNSNFFVTE